MVIRAQQFLGRLCLVLVICGTLAGCGEKAVKTDIGTKSEIAIALGKISSKDLARCDTSLAPAENQIGDLLSDFNTIATKGGICAAKFDGLAGYIEAVMQKFGIVPSPVPLPKPAPQPTAAIVAPKQPPK